MNAHRTLGLLAAIVVTAGQTVLFAVDTAAGARDTGNRTQNETVLGTTATADAQVAYDASRGLVGG